MGVRGNRIAVDQADRRDEHGHSLPSDTFMHFVAIEVACRPCQREGVETILGAWAVETHDATFDPNQLFNKGENQNVTIQELPDGSGAIRQRYKMTCPRCGNAPVLRAERVTAALSHLYQQGARALVRRIHL
ncbi:hypothetical protein [Pedococcus sp. 5OH_020]|uniref:hypothetical protein n=1 Tax=Pedococcus sp. 5OH_020 TaxID=2989814 RepID=UPI0022EA03CF|nr:hypothetical protein [Pedococcus sp. 5OH_020]